MNGGRCHHGRHVDVQPVVGECRQVGGARVRSIESEAPVPAPLAARRRTGRATSRRRRLRARDRAGGSCPSRRSGWTGCGRRGDRRSPRSSTPHARGVRGRYGNRGTPRSCSERSRRRQRVWSRTVRRATKRARWGATTGAAGAVPHASSEVSTDERRDQTERLRPRRLGWRRERTSRCSTLGRERPSSSSRASTT